MTPPPPNPDPAPTDDKVRAAEDRFVESWGRMGSAWGISRTMAEVHALLYITGEPLCADDIIDRLNISRGNASMTLRSLTDWGIVHRAHKRGDRKEYFHAEADVWTMVKTIARERKKRELDPVVASLFDIRDSLPTAENTDAPDHIRTHNERLDNMLELFSRLDALAETFLDAQDSDIANVLDMVSERPNDS